MAIIDGNGRAFAILAGRPSDEAYVTLCQGAAREIEDGSREIRPKGPTKTDLGNCQGQYLSRMLGFSHGGSRKVGI